MDAQRTISKNRRAEFEQMLSLLKEYTDKLREISDINLSRKSQRDSALIGIFIGLCAFIIGGLYLDFPLPLNYSDRTFVMILSPFVLLVVFILFLQYLSQRKIKPTSTTEQVALAVRSLVRVISQYNEHSNKGIRFRYEVDLRLAEAEAAISSYEKIFGVKGWNK